MFSDENQQLDVLLQVPAMSMEDLLCLFALALALALAHAPVLLLIHLHVLLQLLLARLFAL
jgi:hypothetical protein